jgi:hypothetical protein
LGMSIKHQHCSPCVKVVEFPLELRESRSIGDSFIVVASFIESRERTTMNEIQVVNEIM